MVCWRGGGGADVTAGELGAAAGDDGGGGVDGWLRGATRAGVS